MTKNELDNSLDFINNPTGELQVIIYGCLENGDVKKLDIRLEDLEPIKQLFVNAVNSQIVNKADYSVIDLSTADERGNCFYLFDLEIPEELQQLENVIGNDNLETFNFNDNKLADIHSLIIVLADNNNEISLYKKLSPIEVIGRGGFLLWKEVASERFERFNEQVLRISPKFQVLRVQDQLIILDLGSIERNFGIDDVIIREANIGLEAIRSIDIVSNIETLEEIVTDVKFARKLTKIARTSPVILKNIPNTQIIAFSRTHPAIKNKIKLSADGTQFSLDTKKSKDLFVKLLNDDFLTSELTRLYYDSLAKDNIEEEIENV